ncbi:hypothetical protein LMTR13_24760 [Bradyrhizobium icense]|uniref:Electron transfer flavoprotein alpha/beta-subunit N-terminal domain-containing protein n=1 Tax=Bradyrhizobium icense TaxID=1274631 RepID=A0A1B1UJD9_9BRAD|nr:hypothetical protein LMTR13_24760 [Bradyrhizobium icense]
MSDVIRAPAERPAAKKALPGHFNADKHAWVFIEQERGQVHPISWKLMGAGRKLAEKRKADLAPVVIGPEGEATRSAPVEFFSYADDLVHLVADNMLADYRNQSYSMALTDPVNTHKPEILLLGATILGRDLAASEARRIHATASQASVRSENMRH